MNRVTRDRPLTKREASKYKRIRKLVKREFFDLISQVAIEQTYLELQLRKNAWRKVGEPRDKEFLALRAELRKLQHQRRSYAA